MDFLNKPHQIYLAPMSGITDKSFRLLMRELGVDIVVSELLSAESITNAHTRTLKMLSILEEEKPVGIQLFGGDPQVMNQAAKIAIDLGADFIDINLGCPKPKVTKKRSGSVLLQDPKYLFEFLSIINTGLKKPLTVKMRTGWNATHRNADENIQAAQNAGVAMIAIHGRDREQGYSGLADWPYIKTLKPYCKVPLVGNGDIRFAQQARDLLKNCYSDSIMIGRGCLLNPLLPLQIKQINPTANHTLLEIVERYLEITEKHVDPAYLNIKRAKIFHWFSLPYADTETFKSQVFNARTDSQALIKLAREYFKNKDLPPTDSYSIENFLMAGHG